MAGVADYPVSFPFGATSAPYSPSRPHRGNDRAAPCGTPIIVGGVQIGLVGQTGLATGCHLHAQAGTDKACQNTFEPSPLEFQPGTVVNRGTASEWGNFVTVQVGDRYITYAHMQRIDVSLGQVLNGGVIMPVPTDVLRIIAGEVEGFDRTVYDGAHDQTLAAAWANKPVEEFVRHGFQVSTAKRYQLQEKIAALEKKVKELEAGAEYQKAPDLFIKKG